MGAPKSSRLDVRVPTASLVKDRKGHTDTTSIHRSWGTNIHPAMLRPVWKEGKIPAELTGMRGYSTGSR